MAGETIIAGKLTLDGAAASKTVKSIKTELKEANAELITMQRQFGATSAQALEAARRVAELRDSIQEAREVTELFDPGARFQAFGNVLRTVAGGFSALTGTMALFGAESAEVEKTLLKVQAALAVTEGLNTIVDAAKDFDRLKAVALDAFKSIKAAIGSTGIGLLVIALGAIYTYWDDIKEAVSGVSSEQEKVLATATKAVAKEKEKLDHLDDQDEILKHQGKSEKQILEMKEKQVKSAIEASEVQLAAQKDIVKAQVATAERNRELLQGLINFVTVPLRVLLTGIDYVAEKLGHPLNLVKGLDNVATLIFDPKKVQAEADKANKETEYGITKLKNQYAGYQNQIKAIDKEALEAHKANLAKIKSLTDAAADVSIADANILAQRKLDQQYEADKKAAAQEIKNKKDLNDYLIALGYKYRVDSDALLDAELKANQAAAAKNKEIADAKAKADAQRLSDFKKDGTDKINEIAAFNNELANSQLDAAGQQAAASLAQLNDYYNQKYDLIKGNAQAEADLKNFFDEQVKKIEEEKLNKRLDTIKNFLGQSSQLFGQATIAGKALAIAQTTIDTYQSATSSYKALSGIPIIGPTLGFVAAGVAIANGLANVKKIISVQVPGATGGAAPSISSSAPAPLAPRAQVTNTRLPQDQINSIGNAAAPVKAYVVESDISGSQDKITRLNRAAKLGG